MAKDVDWVQQVTTRVRYICKHERHHGNITVEGLSYETFVYSLDYSADDLHGPETKIKGSISEHDSSEYEGYETVDIREFAALAGKLAGLLHVASQGHSESLAKLRELVNDC
jgi:hypothetical protein